MILKLIQNKEKINISRVDLIGLGEVPINSISISDRSLYELTYFASCESHKYWKLWPSVEEVPEVVSRYLASSYQVFVLVEILEYMTLMSFFEFYERFVFKMLAYLWWRYHVVEADISLLHSRLREILKCVKFKKIEWVSLLYVSLLF